MPTEEENVKYLYLVLTAGGVPQIDWSAISTELDLKVGATKKRWSRLKTAMDKGADLGPSAQRLLWLCHKHSARDRAPDWDAIARQCNIPTAGAASKRYSRLKQAFEKGTAEMPAPGTPTKFKATPSTSTPIKARSTPAKTATPKTASKTNDTATDTTPTATKRKRAPAKGNTAATTTTGGAAMDMDGDGDGDGEQQARIKQEVGVAVASNGSGEKGHGEDEQEHDSDTNANPNGTFKRARIWPPFPPDHPLHRPGNYGEPDGVYPDIGPGFTAVNTKFNANPQAQANIHTHAHARAHAQPNVHAQAYAAADPDPAAAARLAALHAELEIEVLKAQAEIDRADAAAAAAAAAAGTGGAIVKQEAGTQTEAEEVEQYFDALDRQEQERGARRVSAWLEDADTV